MSVTHGENSPKLMRGKASNSGSYRMIIYKTYPPFALSSAVYTCAHGEKSAATTPETVCEVLHGLKYLRYGHLCRLSTENVGIIAEDCEVPTKAMV